LDAALWSHGSADCAIVVNPQLENSPLNANRFAVPEEWIATQVHFDRLQIADEAFFIGFPGFDGRTWFDEAAVLPIARAASLASIPSVPFTNIQIRTDDVLMVAGLSFSGLAAVSLSTAAKEFRPAVTSLILSTFLHSSSV
jgi:hypothetical protein